MYVYNLDVDVPVHERVYSTNKGIVFAPLFMKNPPEVRMTPPGSDVTYPNPTLPIVLSYCTVSHPKL
jgi:hypothetical protein